MRSAHSYELWIWFGSGYLQPFAVLTFLRLTEYNSMTLHTGAGCSITNNGQYAGTMTTQDCNVAAPGQSDNAGCQINTPNTASYGTGFNAQGGGVYATEWTSSSISIWFFPRGSVPSDVSSGNPDPTGWGEAIAIFSGDCDIDSHFKNQQIVSRLTKISLS